MPKVFITKYALTTGIFEVECELSDGMACDRTGSFTQYFHGEGREWHRTWESALARAEVMRTKKLASLTKQSHHLRNVVFKQPK